MLQIIVGNICIYLLNEHPQLYYEKLALLEEQGYEIGIAAYALAENAILITNNMAEFNRISQLKLEN